MQCSIEKCELVAVCRGWCEKHYARWKRYRDPLGSPPPVSVRPKYQLSGRYGDWEVVAYQGKGEWLCRCIRCGEEHLRITASLRETSKHHHKVGKHPLYRKWCGMIRRCHNSADPRYMYYGGRGINVCDRWRESFEHFVEDMGMPVNKSYTLERINVNGDYSPENCKWASWEEQANNKTTNVYITFNGKTLTAPQWEREGAAVKAGAIRARLKRGWTDIQEILFMPARGIRHANVVI